MHIKIAGGLLALRKQLDDIYPGRSTASDGFLASPEHTIANPLSDHEPWYEHEGMHYVTAGDFTHDPDDGISGDALAAVLDHWRDPRIKYVIWDRQIMSGRFGPAPWARRKYNGKNPHTAHVHLSVLPDPISLFNDRWKLDPLEDVMQPEQVWSWVARDLYNDTTCRTVDALEVAAETGQSNADRLTLIEKRLDMIAAKLGAE